MKKYIVVVDIDGTLANINHREELAQAGKWDDFHAKCYKDDHYQDIVDLVNALASKGFWIVACTGRNEKYRALTFDWFMWHRVQIDELLMRSDTDFRSDVEMKINALEELLGSKDRVLARVLCVIDDRDKVVDGLRNYGLTVLQPRQGTY